MRDCAGIQWVAGCGAEDEIDVRPCVFGDPAGERLSLLVYALCIDRSSREHDVSTTARRLHVSNDEALTRTPLY